nr:DUF6634 family protein [Pseudooceanicola algae]
MYLTAFRAVCLGVDPDRSELEAPFLDNWTAAMRGREVFLVGSVTGHPVLGDRRIQTSTLIHLSPDREWARTLSRWYKLGPAFVPKLPGEYLDDVLPGYLVAVDKGVISLPIHVALKCIARRTQQVFDLAFKAGYDDLIPELSRLARAWPVCQEKSCFK